MIKVIISEEVRSPFKYKRLYKKIAKTTLELLKIHGHSEVNVIIVDNDLMKKIYKQYKKKDKATDVLSFEADFKKLAPMIGYNMLGDIYINWQKVEEQAKEYNHSTKREWAYLFAHGLLHVCGYDHMNEKDEKIMNSLASKIMERVKVGRNV